MVCKHKRQKCIARIEIFPRPGRNRERTESEQIVERVLVCKDCGDTKLDRFLMEGLDIKPGFYRVHLAESVLAQLTPDQPLTLVPSS